MGTSKPYGGAGSPPLLPPWATGDGSPQPPGNPSPDGNENGGPTPAPPVPPLQQSPPPLPSPLPLPAPRLTPWTPAKRAMGNFAKGGGAHNLGNAARNYVRARGGAKSAARAASGGRQTTASLGGFLSGVASRGIVEVVRELGLAAVIGQPVEIVLTEITNRLAPEGTTLEDAVARRAFNETLAAVFEKYGVEQDGLTKLNALDAEGVREAIEMSIVSYIYQRWLQELEIKVEERAISEREAVRCERDVRIFVRDAVSVDMAGKNLLTLRWNDREGREIIERIYQQAYSTLER